MALGWQPKELGEWREQMLFAQPPPPLSEISAKLGDGEREDGGRGGIWRRQRGSWVRPGWAVPALAAASPLCHLSRSPHPLLSLFLSLLHPQQNEERKTGSWSPTPNLCRTPLYPPTTHHIHTTTKPSKRSPSGFGSPSFLRPSPPHTKTGVQCFLKTDTCIFYKAT